MSIRLLPLLLLLMPAVAEVVYEDDFEGELNDRYTTGGATLRREAGPTGQCIVVANETPARYAMLTLQGPFELVRNLVLEFDVSATAIAGETNYVGIQFYSGDAQFWSSVPFEEEWQHVELPIALMGSPTKHELRLGLPLDRLNLYGRARDDAGAVMTVRFDNLKLVTRPVAGKLSDRVRISNANPPLFEWPDQKGSNRLALSRSPAFPDDATTIVDLDRNWYLPAQPLGPGTWYWRYGYRNELLDGWADAAAVTIPAEAHRFDAGRVPLEALAAQPHPRLLDAATERQRVDAARLAQLKVEAKRIHEGGVPDEIPIWEEGDPRWPTWIDWYGKVAGGMTGRTGRLLQRLGYLTMVTGDPEVAAWCEELALKAAGWNPTAGSHMSRGDIGAHHLLRGFNWCYDALAATRSSEQLAPLREVIVTRAEQFWNGLNPFRLNEFNNHAWLRAFGVAESGLVLTGEVPQAGDWVQYLLDLYVGRFLCALGYQGDNNEGISYWGYGLMFVIDYAKMMKDVTGIDLFQHPWLYQTARFPMYTAIPGAYAVSFADTGQPNHGVIGPAQVARVRDLASQTRDPYALWYGTFREPVDGVSPKPPVDIPQSIWYRFIGWAVFNTDLVHGAENVTVAMRSGPFYAGHQHEDLNAFVINAYGAPLAIDGGHYDWYGSAQFKNWSTLTRAHNSILVNGEDQHSRQDGADGSITSWFDSPTAGYTVGLVADPDVYAGQVERFERKLLFLKPDLVIVADDLRAAQGPAKWDWLLHSIAPIETDGAGFRFTKDGASLTGGFAAPADVELAVTTGYPDNAQPVDRYSTRPSPPERTPLEYHLTATPGEKRVDEAFVAVMAIGREQPIDLRVEPLEVAGGRGASWTGGRDGFAMIRTGDGGVRSSVGEAEAEMVAYTARPDEPAALFAAEVTRLDLPAVGVALTATRPVSLSIRMSPQAWVADLSAPEPTDIRFARLPGYPTWQLDQQALAPAGGELRVRLDEGTHELVGTLGDPAALLGQALKPLTVRVGDAQAELPGYARRTATGRRTYHWGSFQVAAAGYHEVEADGDGIDLALDGKAMQPGEAVWLTAGHHWLDLQGDVPRIRLLPQDSTTGAAEMLAPDYRPPMGALVVEAEAPVAEGEVKGKVMEKVGASGGVAHCVWDTVGQWAEWRFEVPVAGRYRLLIRGCAESEPARRGLFLDGEPLPEAMVIELPPTGGWSRTSDDWRWFGGPTVSLRKGAHVLRIQQLGGSMNLDQVGWSVVE